MLTFRSAALSPAEGLKAAGKQGARTPFRSAAPGPAKECVTPPGGFDPFVGVENPHETFADDITGQHLKPDLCCIARQKELD